MAVFIPGGFLMRLPYGISPEAVTQAKDRGRLHVRPLALKDRAAWGVLWRGYLDFYDAALSEAQYELTWARLNDPEEPLFGYLADFQGAPVGLVHMIFHRSAWLDGPSCYLQDLFADPHTRGQGVGRALIEHVYDVARASGSGRVHWLTKHDNATARLLYDRIASESKFVQYVKVV
jgi:GNAT superfamily N-acetyltransferase